MPSSWRSRTAASPAFSRAPASARDARLVLFRAPAIVFATGGIGALYAVTTNPLETRGEGLGMAARAGAVIADPEFVQFHPTAIAIGRDPAPLATEALRGEGAILVDESGRRFMLDVHPDAELAPRDVVARALHRERAVGHKTFLDCTQAIGAAFAQRFPTVYGACMAAGIDPATQAIPVAPAAHYHMGGIAADERGRSSLEGLWAVGECAATGLHGANRLASNSLLEGLVFGARAAEDIAASVVAQAGHGTPPAPERFASPAPPHVLREAMTRLVGLERDEAGLSEALGVIAQVERAGGNEPALLHMTAAATLVTAAALTRRESRGGHYRSDYPEYRPGAAPHLHDAGRRGSRRRQRAEIAARRRDFVMVTALPFTRPPHALLLEPIVRRALEEDLGRAGDITSELTVPAETQARAKLVARKSGTIAGLAAAETAFRLADARLKFVTEAPDGSTVQSGTVLAVIEGPARAILSGERVALNFAGHLSGVATATHTLVEAIAGTKARIICTRKTTPGLRIFEKYAVRCGGGFNHRFGLDDAVLIKDNHLVAAGGIKPAIERVRAGLGHMAKIELEVDTLAQLEEALSLKIDTILLDNMPPDILKQAVALAKGRATLEASGNVTLATVRAVAETGVDYISSGAITHSATNLDLGLDF